MKDKKPIKTNRLVHGVFTKIVGDANKSPVYDQFTDNRGNHTSARQKECITEYKDKLTSIKSELEQLVMLEEIIIQMGCIDNTNLSEISLSIFKDYIYARAPFYRRNMSGKDIRIIVGNINTLGTDLKALKKDTKFMQKTYDLLEKRMNAELIDRLSKYERTKIL